MVSVDKAYMIGHMRNANGSLNNKNVVLSAACEAAELFQCMMEINQKLDDWQRFNHTLNMHLRSVECEKIHDICQAGGRILWTESEQKRNGLLSIP